MAIFNINTTDESQRIFPLMPTSQFPRFADVQSEFWSGGILTHKYHEPHANDCFADYRAHHADTGLFPSVQRKSGTIYRYNNSAIPYQNATVLFTATNWSGTDKVKVSSAQYNQYDSRLHRSSAISSAGVNAAGTIGGFYIDDPGVFDGVMPRIGLCMKYLVLASKNVTYQYSLSGMYPTTKSTSAPPAITSTAMASIAWNESGWGSWCGGNEQAYLASFDYVIHRVKSYDSTYNLHTIFTKTCGQLRDSTSSTYKRLFLTNLITRWAISGTGDYTVSYLDEHVGFHHSFFQSY